MRYSCRKQSFAQYNYLHMMVISLPLSFDENDVKSENRCLALKLSGHHRGKCNNPFFSFFMISCRSEQKREPIVGMKSEGESESGMKQIESRSFVSVQGEFLNAIEGIQKRPIASPSPSNFLIAQSKYSTYFPLLEK